MFCECNCQCVHQCETCTWRRGGVVLVGQFRWCFIGDNLIRYRFWTASVCHHLPTETFSQCLADGGQVVVLNRLSENLKKWPRDTHTHTNRDTLTHNTHTHALTHTYTHRRQLGRLISVVGFFFRAASSQASGGPGAAAAAAGQPGSTVTDPGSPGRCPAPPPAQPLWRPSWRGRSRWWGVHQPSSRSCSVGDREKIRLWWKHEHDFLLCV